MPFQLEHTAQLVVMWWVCCAVVLHFRIIVSNKVHTISIKFNCLHYVFKICKLSWAHHLRRDLLTHITYWEVFQSYKGLSNLGPSRNKIKRSHCEGRTVTPIFLLSSGWFLLNFWFYHHLQPLVSAHVHPMFPYVHHFLLWVPSQSFLTSLESFFSFTRIMLPLFPCLFFYSTLFFIIFLNIVVVIIVHYRNHT